MTRAIIVGGVVLAAVAVAVVAALGDRSSSSSSSAPPSSSGPPPRTRAAVVAWAASQVGAGDPAPYWASALPGATPDVLELDWCGAFVLWALHQAGLALDVTWKLGRGFLMVSRPGLPNGLPMTKQPQPGDVAYFDQNQHHAIVEAVEPGAVHLINGNGTGGRVTRSTVAPIQVTAFFSIEPLLPAVSA